MEEKKIRTAILHNGSDSSVTYAEQLAAQIPNECVLADINAKRYLRELLPIRAVPNVMVCLFCEGMEEYQAVSDILGQLRYIGQQEALAQSLTDEQAAFFAQIYESWKSGIAYAAGDRRRHAEKLWKCLQAHTSQEGWEPENTPALWVEIAAPGEYRQIQDGMLSTEAFSKGEIGWYQSEDNLYRSLIDANIWTPESYPDGWEKVN